MVLHLAAIITSCVSITFCGVTPAHGVRTSPVYFSTRDNLPCDLAICVNNNISLCIGLVHDIFMRNIYYGIDMKIYN